MFSQSQFSSIKGPGVLQAYCLQATNQSNMQNMHPAYIYYLFIGVMISGFVFLIFEPLTLGQGNLFFMHKSAFA
jgi:hypothetical protein